MSNRESQLKPFLEIDNGVSLKKALLQGIGIGAFWYDRGLIQSKRLIDVFHQLPPEIIPYYYCFHKRLENSVKIKEFYIFIQKLFAKHYIP